MWEAAAASDGTKPELLFTENDSNLERLHGVPSDSPYVKDAFHRRVVGGETAAVNPKRIGTKVAAWYRLRIPAGGSVTVETRLVSGAETGTEGRARPATEASAQLHALRARETDAFYDNCLPDGLSPDERHVVRQGYAGLLWSKQFFHYIVDDWLDGDPGQPPPPGARKSGRNAEWRHLYARDVISMPDKWEYPWFAAWDLAFHMLPMAMVDQIGRAHV